MQLLDYVPLIVVFISAIIGIAGKTWDSEKKGLSQLTPKGRCIVAIAIISLLYGIFTVSANHNKLDQRTQIALLANQQIVRGIEHLLKPLCYGFDIIPAPTTIDEAFEVIRSDKNLERQGRVRLVNRLVHSTVIANTNQGYAEFDEVYQLYDFYINTGTKLINDTLTKYSAVLSLTLIMRLEKLLQDDFLVKNYQLATKRSYFELGLNDEKRQPEPEEDSPWLTAGLHWFNAVYLKDKSRSGDYRSVKLFLGKAQQVTKQISESGPVSFRPC